jgi:hypothetical protein
VLVQSRLAQPSPDISRCHLIVDEDTKKQVRTTLVKDKQLPDKSFKALAVGVLAKLG